MSCSIVTQELFYDEGVDDFLFWEIEGAEVDPLGYTAKIGETTYSGNVEPTETGALVTFIIPALTKGTYDGYVITNNKVQGHFHQLKLKIKVTPTVDAI